MELFATTGDAFVRVGGPTCLQGSGTQCLARDRDTVYVGCRGGGLKRSADGGDSFADLPLPEADVFSVAVNAADGAVYAGTEPSRLFRSHDGGETWEELVALQEIPSRALDHPQVIPIHVAGEHDGQLYLPIRFVEGEDLKPSSSERGPSRRSARLAVLTQIGTRSTQRTGSVDGAVSRPAHPHANALTPVMSRPTISDWIVSVPSKV